MNKTILLTRPKKDSEVLAKKLQDLGYKTIICPLFSIKTLIPTKDYKNPQSIIISSANAINFLIKLKLPKNILILAIGDETKNKIVALGYQNVTAADNGAESLVKLALKKLTDKNSLVLYLSGNLITLDIAAKLRKKGFNAKRIVAYRIIAKKSLPKLIIKKIKDKNIRNVAIYSKNTASIFYKLLKKHNLLEYSSQIKLLCLSTEIAKHAKTMGHNKVSLIEKLWTKKITKKIKN